MSLKVIYIMKSQKLLNTLRFIEGEKVCLEPFSYKRLLSFYSLYKTSRQKWEQFIVLHFHGIDDVKRFIAQQTQKDYFSGYFILEKKSFKLVGFLLGDEISASEIAITYAIGSQYEGRGYAYEARQLFEKLSKKADYTSIISFCDAENVHRNKLIQDGYLKESTQKISLGSCSMNIDIYRKLL